MGEATVAVVIAVDTKGAAPAVAGTTVTMPKMYSVIQTEKLLVAQQQKMNLRKEIPAQLRHALAMS